MQQLVGGKIPFDRVFAKILPFAGAHITSDLHLNSGSSGLSWGEACGCLGTCEAAKRHVNQISILVG